MAADLDSSVAEAALRNRLRVVGRTLGLSDQFEDGADVDTFELVTVLAGAIKDSRDPATVWLVIVGLTGAYPPVELVQGALRQAELEPPQAFAWWLLQTCSDLAKARGSAGATLVLVDDRPLVDVSHTAKTSFLTGIQRVVRSTARQWSVDHEVELVVWNSLEGAYRPLDGDERRQLMRSSVKTYRADERLDEQAHDIILVPWKVPVVVLEVPSAGPSICLAALGTARAGSLRVVGYDCIPVTSAEMVGDELPGRFGIYLEMVKVADRVAGISETAAREFSGFTSALVAQGLDGPVVSTCSLPTETTVPGGDSEEGRRVNVDGRAIVLCVGSITRRKNQSSLVVAAERLWREGLDFELRLLGHLGGEEMPIHRLIPELHRMGRPLVVERGVSDSRIAHSLAEARMLVLPSTHEGFGLPIVEALSAGVPVITSDFGSMREVAENQGGLLVDPEDLDALTDAMRRLLTDETLHAELVRQAMDRSVKDWREYSTELWEVLCR